MGDERSRSDLHAEGLVEVPRGSRNKFGAGRGRRDLVRPQGRGARGFPVSTGTSSYPGVHVVARVLGAFVIRTGEAIETKLLCVSERDHHQNHLRELDDLPTNALDELDACFAAYRMLKPGACEVVDHLGRDEVVREWLHGHPPADPHRTNGQL